MVMVFRSAWMPAPPLESLPAIDNAVFMEVSPLLRWYRDQNPAAQRPQAVREGLRNGMGEQNLPGLAGQGLGGGLDILCPKEAGDHGDARRAGPL